MNWFYWFYLTSHIIDVISKSSPRVTFIGTLAGGILLFFSFRNPIISNSSGQSSTNDKSVRKEMHRPDEKEVKRLNKREDDLMMANLDLFVQGETMRARIEELEAEMVRDKNKVEALHKWLFCVGELHPEGDNVEGRIPEVSSTDPRQQLAADASRKWKEFESNVVEVANALASQHPSGEPFFIHALDLDAMNTPEFPEYVNSDPVVVIDSEFVVGMKFNFRETVSAAIKDYTIRRGVDYQVCESEPTTFYAKRYNGSHTCTRTRISQDHAKINSDMIAEVIKPLIETDPSLKVKSVIAKVRSKFNYTTNYCKIWLAKQKAIANLYGGWEASYGALPSWFEAMIESLVVMSLRVVQTNNLIGNNTFMRYIG
ncbi:hypothetical protein Ahy_B03g065753 [Arachis hypogaea]|uniref:Transposase MuDR plant domain-containing protein n=1 Tax=Arachis hypogaea TaxID=3818 RepID=A0A445A2C8_ARAHY|nr:hypothetical protein Ahy_B03g065753 [Arachis hypogaea]